MKTFLSFPSGDLKALDKVFFTKGIVSFTIVGPDRTGCADDLSGQSIVRRFDR